MFNLKVNGIIAGIAFVLSLLVGIVSGANLFILFIRALVLGAAFFVFTGCVFIVLRKFLPELFKVEQPEQEHAPGSRVNISVGDEDIKAEPAVQEEKKTDSISSLDQNNKNGYTKEGGAAAENSSSFKPLPDTVISSPNKTPDRVTGGDNRGSLNSGAENSGKPPKQKNKEKTFDSRQMASAIQTILRDE